MANESSVIPGDWSYDRCHTYRALLAVPGLELSNWIEPLLLALPFRLGESAAEAAIPFAFDDDFNDLTNFAVDDLVDLVRRRRERPPTSTDVQVEARGLRPATWSLAGFTEGSPGLPVAARAIRLDSQLDSGLFEVWIPRGHGGPLFERLIALYKRLIEEDQRLGRGPAHLALGLLGTLAHLETKKVRGKALVTRAYPFERLDRTLGSALFALVEAALDRALAGAPAGYQVLAKAILGPLSFFSFREQPLLADFNPWGLSEGFAHEADQVWLAQLEENPNPRDADQRLAAAFLADPKLRARAAEAGGVLQMRRRVLDFLALYDGHDPDLSQTLVGVAQSTEYLCSVGSDSKAVLSKVQKFAKSLKPDPTGEAVIAALVDSLKGGLAREDFIKESTEAYTTMALDRVAAEAVERARAHLKDRRAEYSREQLVADYLAGRLYRLAADGKPIRRAQVKKTQGHLFIDLKGFTQRTYRAKELVMAEFLRTEFYEPILAAATKRVEGLGGEPQLALQNLLGDAAVFSGEMATLVELALDIQRICRAYADKLRSRAGGDGKDADGRRAEIETKLRTDLDGLRAEAARLEREMQAKRAMPVAQLEQALFSSLAQRIADLEARRHDAAQRGRGPEANHATEAVAALRAREKELFGRVEHLFGAARDRFVADLVLAEDRQRQRELQRQAAETRTWAQGQLRALDEETRGSRGGGLEAGLFITFGANAEIASMTDPHFGPVKVAVAEKINEAARGTARNAMIKAKLDAMLGKARAQRNNPRLELPFRVYVDSAYNLLLPADLSDAIDAAVREREPGRAREAAKAVAETVLRDLARAMGVGDGQPPEALSALSDIYNTGEALSGEALAAFLTSTAPARSWFRKAVAIDELDPEFLDLFAFVQDSIDLVVSVPSDGDTDQAICFRRAGQVQFRGFEGKSPTTVWELLRPDASFALLLTQKHLPLWAAENKGRAPESLPT